MTALIHFRFVGRHHSKCPAVLIAFLTIFTTAEATCNEEQIEICRKAALSGRLEVLRSSGECLAKRYMEFSHLCSVTNYLPTVDYCCCRHLQDALLCCRYHQDWNRFRCQDPDDVIMTRGPGTKGALVDLPPLEILLPSTLVPLVVLLFGCFACAVVCFCWRRRRRQRRLQKTTNGSEDGIRHEGLNDDFSQHRCLCCCCPDSRKTKRISQRRLSSEEDRGVNSSSAAAWPDDEAAALTTPLNDHPPPTDRPLRPLSVSLLPYDSSSSESHRHRRFPSSSSDFGRHPPLPPVYTPDPPPCPVGAFFVEPSAPPAADVIPVAAAAAAAAGVSPALTRDAFAAAWYSADARPPYGDEASTTATETDRGGEGSGVSVVFCPRCSHLQPPPPPYDESLTHRVV